MSTYDNWKAREPEGEPWCDWCNDTGVKHVRYTNYNEVIEDGERACSNCCAHRVLVLISGPGIACAECGDWFANGEDVEASRRENAENRPHRVTP